MGLGILGVRPSKAEVTGLDEIRAALFTGLVVGVGEGDGSVELVIDLVSGVQVHGP